MIKVKFEIRLSAKKIADLIKLKGYQIQSHDFGYWATEYHNKPSWREDICDGVCLEHRGWIKLEEAFELLYQEEVEQHLLSIFRQ